MTRLLYLSNNEDLKKQIEQYATNFEIVGNNPEVVVIDEDASKIKEYLHLPIIFLSSNLDPQNVVTIKKPFALNTFFEKLNSCLMVFENAPNFAFEWGNFSLLVNNKELCHKKSKTSYKLTEKEVDILKYLYKNKDEFVSKKDLLESVWGYNPEISTHTIETHIYRLRQKIEETSEALIETNEGGYKLAILS